MEKYNLVYKNTWNLKISFKDCLLNVDSTCEIILTLQTTFLFGIQILQTFPDFFAIKIINGHI